MKEHTGVRGASRATGGVVDTVGLLGALGVEVGLSLLGDGDGVLTLVCGRHYDRCSGLESCWVVVVGFVKVVEDKRCRWVSNGLYVSKGRKKYRRHIDRQKYQWLPLSLLA